MPFDRSKARSGFTLVELLAVIATIAVLASLLFPILSKVKTQGQRTACISNLHQLGLAWLSYKDDFAGYLPESYPTSPEAWVKGDMTLLNEATDPELIRQGKMFPYAQNERIYRCPTDRGVSIGNRLVQNTRSYSMNSFMGARDPGVIPIPSSAADFVVFAKDSDLRKPAEHWVLLDEDERSINDGFFVTDPNGRLWIDFPAISTARHDFCLNLNFADGHCDTWRYKDPNTLKVSGSWTESSGNADLIKLAKNSTIRK